MLVGNESSLLECIPCGENYKGTCGKGQRVCFRYGQPGHLIIGCASKTERAAGIHSVSVYPLERTAGSTSKDFEKIRVNHEAKKIKETEAIRNSGSISWKGRKFGGRGKGKQLQVKQMCNKFKRSISLINNFARPLIIPQCVGCGKEHLRRCATRELLCYKCGKSGHIAKDCYNLVVMAAAVQTAPFRCFLGMQQDLLFSDARDVGSFI
ncbi:cellular nucleic acid-binding protein homolog [Gastrolobium bilobum]|uniref:cellular nucleic acid-binding protein homolog n=1 Tax=Gastrolobium bilobum TaxID=150636 RepID=UPI002AB18B72|nr:cellular nucleic acid-binding protein homolog [Gastrolobium bilobum]